MRYLLATTAAVLAPLGLDTLQAQALGCEHTELVQSWYLRYLGRQADPCGLNHWVKHLRCGERPEEVEALILASDEYYHRNGCTPEGFVNGLYRDILGRSACPQEVHSWACQLHQCGCRKKLACNFLRASRYELAQRASVFEAPGYAPVPRFAPAPEYAPAPRYVPAPEYPPAPGYTPAPGYVPPVVPGGVSRVYRPDPPLVPGLGYRLPFRYSKR
jgi:hypothetical protein